MTTTKERGAVVMGGMGGFLNPPTHPEHNQHVETDLHRRPENRSSMSLSAAAECEWLDNATRAAARTVLNSWKRPRLDSEEVQDWIRQVLGYFKNCYKGPGDEPTCWHANNLIITNKGDATPPVDDHAGVHLIRKYYPEYIPQDDEFSQAYWGTKPS